MGRKAKSKAKAGYSGDSEGAGKSEAAAAEFNEEDPEANKVNFRAKVEEFLNRAKEIIQSDETRKELQDSPVRPNIQLIEIQRRLWEELGVEPKSGYMVVNQLQQLFPDWVEDLLPKKIELGKAILEAFKHALDDRRPATLQKEGKMSREKFLEFLDAVDVYFDLPEIRERLNQHVVSLGSMPTAVVNEIHGEILEKVGLEKQFGEESMKKLAENEEIAGDEEVGARSEEVRMKTYSTCMSLLRAHQKGGGTVDANEAIMSKLLEIRAREECSNSSPEECDKLIEQNRGRVQVLREMQPDGRTHYLQKLTDDKRLELAKAEILMINLEQRAKAAYQSQMHQLSAEQAAKSSAKPSAKKGEKPIDNID